MVEILRLDEVDVFPESDAWILIEKRETLYFVRGQAGGMTVEASLAATGIDSADVAIRAALAWADLLTVPIIYVREGLSQRPTIEGSPFTPRSPNNDNRA